jgi:hypothetical protein
MSLSQHVLEVASNYAVDILMAAFCLVVYSAQLTGDALSEKLGAAHAAGNADTPLYEARHLL